MFLRFVAHAATQAVAGPVVALRMIEDRLYSSTQYGGGLHLWNTGVGLEPLEASVDFRATHAGLSPDLGVIAGADGTPALLTGGGAVAALRLIDLGADGGFGQTASLGIMDGWEGGLEHSVTVDIGSAQMVFGALAGAQGLGWLRFEAGVLADHGVVADTAQIHSEDAQGLATFVIGGQRYLIGLGGDDPGLTAWRVAADGAVQVAGHLEVDEGLWISAPTALAQATVDGRSFVVVAAAGSGSLSVVEVRQTGRMVVVDHVLDDRSTRFGGVEALAVVTHQGQPWVVAGGADDGVSVFRILPGGRLLGQAHMAQDTQAHLGDVSALAARSDGDGIDIYVGSFQQAGVTALRLETGPAGGVLLAQAAGGALRGGEAADVLIDGAGRDTLTGGRGLIPLCWARTARSM